MRKKGAILKPALLTCSFVFNGILPAACPAEDLGRIATATGGMVVTACPYASVVGRDVLAKGGNAVDAAVAVGFTLAVTYPSAGNIGGGGFMLVRMSDGETDFIDYREKAPRTATGTMYLDDDGDVIPGLSTTGHLASGVPGSVAGLYLAHVLYGSMDWKDLLAPAVELAGNGFSIGSHLARSLLKLQSYVDRYPALHKYTHADGSPLSEGERLVQPLLAATLELIAEEGVDGFYLGRTAELIEKEMERGGGLITRDDLYDYEALSRDPVKQMYRGLEIMSAPPPSSGGGVLIEILNILEGYDLGGEGRRSVRTIHRIVEAERRAYADRAQYYGDPSFVTVPFAILLSKGYADRLRSGIGQRATPSAALAGGLIPGHESEETTHYSIMDAQGNCVATTITLNGAYGSKVIVGGCGFLLNNEMDDFAIKPGVPNMYGLTGGRANAIVPAKRMLSSMTPTIVLKEGSVCCILGTPGGSTIITTVAQILLGIVDFGMTIEDAVSAPRFHHQWKPDCIYYENGCFSRDIIDKLEEMGHRCRERDDPIGDVQAILVGESLLTGVSDPRGGGCAAGLD